jgi:hypothetical protein
MLAAAPESIAGTRLYRDPQSSNLRDKLAELETRKAELEREIKT